MARASGSKTVHFSETHGSDPIDAAFNVFEAISLNKTRVKWTVLFHWSLFLLMLARISGDILLLLNIAAPPIIKQLKLPTAELWELAWLPSVLASTFAYLSLKRNNSALLWQAFFGQIVLGVVPACIGVNSMYPRLENILSSRTTKEAFPTEIFMSAFIAVALQVHFFQLYFSKQLLNAWKSPTAKKIR